MGILNLFARLATSKNHGSRYCSTNIGCFDSQSLAPTNLAPTFLSLFVIWQLGTRTTLLNRFAGDSSPREAASSLNGAHRVEEVNNEGAEVSLRGGNEPSFTRKMKEKSTRIVEAAENGEMKHAIEKCKKFMSSVKHRTLLQNLVNSWRN
eukprot:TRINITY_DN6209_c0_g1_i1.p2 TRINITY_DN6209_c0_g1~~TRINITY_DN6209_c0_g1_i1.p2  ORF type:complete len:174 (-),score=35.03 TRINITY_DN6209_c0_g1_i1:60-509(-)